MEVNALLLHAVASKLLKDIQDKRDDPNAPQTPLKSLDAAPTPTIKVLQQRFIKLGHTQSGKNDNRDLPHRIAKVTHKGVEVAVVQLFNAVRSAGGDAQVCTCTFTAFRIMCRNTRACRDSPLTQACDMPPFAVAL